MQKLPLLTYLHSSNLTPSSLLGCPRLGESGGDDATEEVPLTRLRGGRMNALPFQPMQDKMKCIRARIGIRSGKEPTDKMHKEEGKRQSERAMAFPHLMLFFSILRAARPDDRRRCGRGRVTGDTRGTITGEDEVVARD